VTGGGKISTDAAHATDIEGVFANARAEQARAEQAAPATGLDQPRSDAGSGQPATEQSEADTVLNRERAELPGALGLTSQSADRIEAVRQELTAARRRNIELVDEINALHRNLNRMRGAALLKVIWPIWWLGSHLPPSMRHRIRSGVRAGWRLATFKWLKRAATTDGVTETLASDQSLADQAGEYRTLPSDQQRRLNASWKETNDRAEFIQLRCIQPRAKIAVVVHIYYTEVWPELASAICNIPQDFDLFVTLVTGASDGLAPTIRDRFPNAHVLLVDNHGRDIFPFLALIRTGALFNYELICKVHTKRSPHDGGGEEWRKSLVDGILGSTELAKRILNAFRLDPDLGLVVATGQIFEGRTYWGINEARSAQLLRRIGLNESAFERHFAGGSMFWIRPFILRTIDGMRLGYDDFEPEPISNDGFTAHAVERLFSSVCHDAGMRVQDPTRLVPPVPEASPAKVHVIANYLPQFHPIPENDRWWGKGFTEWSNATKATPLFRGHRQPRLPTDLGFYDLRMPEARAAQAEMARRYGVTAFSYYYYWFNGRRLLNRPIDEVVASGEPDFPFMLCWANEPWTRNWDGLSKEILLPQEYAPGWERAFAADVAQIMRDRRYLRLNDKPMLALYRVAHFPDKIGSIERLRAAFAAEGFPAIHLIGAWVQVGDDEPLPTEAVSLGLDAYFEFPPHGVPSQPLNVSNSDQLPGFAAHVYDYGATVDAVLDRLALRQPGFRHRGVMMGWDNTARRGANAFVFHGATPANFRRWLRAALRTARSEARGPEAAVFINAWNEWAEGTYLEPDRDFGAGWLEAVASATMDATVPPHDSRASGLAPVEKSYLK
jgi:lipopolysaccharide biosynthesis protein